MLSLGKCRPAKDYSSAHREHRWSRQCALLWIRGKPGSGKSTLMKCIVEHLQEEQHIHVISFFFNARGRDLLGRSAAGCYRALLHQLLKLRPWLHDSFDLPDVPPKGTDWPIEVIQDALRQVLLRQKDGRAIFMMVDALDECEAPEIRDMVTFLTDISEEARRKYVDLHVCFASRHYPNITVRMCKIIILENERAHQKSIRKYVRDNLHVNGDSQKNMLRRTIIHKSDGVFMWVVLSINILNERSDQGAMINPQSLDVLPASLHDLYQKITFDAMSDPCFLPIMLWTLVGDSTYLDLQDFCYAVIDSAGETTSPHLGKSNVSDQWDDLKRFVLHSSKGLVEVLGNRHWQFTHESVRHHVINGGLAALHPNLHADHDINAASHAILVQWCQKYLQGDWSRCIDFPSDAPRDRMGNPINRRAMRKFKGFTLLRYSREILFNHIEAAYSRQEFELRCLNTFPLERWIKFHNAYLYSLSHLEPTASLIFVFLEHIKRLREPKIISAMLEHHPSYSAPDTVECKDVLNSQLVFGTSLNDFCGGKCAFPLISAVWNGYAKVVWQLLECGAKANILNTSTFRPRFSKDAGHLDLFGQAAHIAWEFENLVQGRWHSRLRGHPLVAACAYPHEGIRHHMVTSLLDHGADINVQSDRLVGPLGITCFFGFWKTVELLLIRGANVNLEDLHGFNVALKYALFGASARGAHTFRKEQIKRLLPLEAFARPGDLNILLHAAARLGQVKVIEILLHFGADIDCRDMDSRNPLNILAERCPMEAQPEKGAEMLLNLGVDIHAHGGKYDTALIAAAATGKWMLVRWLLNNGADIKHVSGKYGSALDAARASESALDPITRDHGQWAENWTRGQAFTDIIKTLSNAGLK